MVLLSGNVKYFLSCDKRMSCWRNEFSSGAELMAIGLVGNTLVFKRHSLAWVYGVKFPLPASYVCPVTGKMEAGGEAGYSKAFKLSKTRYVSSVFFSNWRGYRWIKESCQKGTTKDGKFCGLFHSMTEQLPKCDCSIECFSVWKCMLSLAVAHFFQWEL